MAEVIALRQAAKEFHEALEWYERIDRKLSQRFRAAVETTLARIADSPTSHPWVDDEYRFVLVKRFRYMVIFREINTELYQVVAIAHTSRDPEYWRSRISQEQ